MGIEELLRLANRVCEEADEIREQMRNQEYLEIDGQQYAVNMIEFRLDRFEEIREQSVPFELAHQFATVPGSGEPGYIQAGARRDR